MAWRNYQWTRDERQLPSIYQFDIDGLPLTAILAKKSEAAAPETYEWITTKTGLSVHAIGVAAGHGEPDYPCKDAVFVAAPVYHKGGKRREGIEAFWAECKRASQLGRAVIVHCNQSFHRGPMLLAAMLNVLLLDALGETPEGSTPSTSESEELD